MEIGAAFKRVLVAGDIHGDMGHADYLVQNAKAHGITRIVQVGDFGAWEHTEKGRDYFDKLDKVAERAGVTVYWVDGNHDKTSLVLELYGSRTDEEGFLLCRDRIRYAPRGHRWTWSERSCMSLGGAYSVDKFPRLEQERAEWKKRVERRDKYGSTRSVDTRGTLWFPEEELTDAELEKALDGPGVDVLFTHDKPRAANPGWNRKDFPECWSNQDRIQKAVRELRPELVVHGHLHYPYETMIYIGEGTRSWVTVRGLDCGQPGYHAGWRRRDSWEILDLETLAFV